VTVGGDDLFSVAEPIPFLIQHDSSGDQHQSELAGADAIGPHPNGASRLQSVVVAVENLADTAGAFAEAYGLIPSVEPFKCQDLGATTVVLALDDVDEQIVLAQPEGAGIAADRLANAGEGVCCVAVAVDDIAATRRYLENGGIRFMPSEESLFIPAEGTGGAPLMFVRDDEGGGDTRGSSVS